MKSVFFDILSDFTSKQIHLHQRRLFDLWRFCATTTRGHRSLWLKLVRSQRSSSFPFGSLTAVMMSLYCDVSVNRRSSPSDTRGQRRGLGRGFAPRHRRERLCASLIVIVVVSRQPAGIVASPVSLSALPAIVELTLPASRPPSLWQLPQEFDESYVQTGQGQLYSWSTQTHRRGATPMVLRCNHTIIYEGQEERQGPVLQLLRVSGINSVYNVFALSLDFDITASLLIPGVRKCEKKTTVKTHYELKRCMLKHFFFFFFFYFCR